METNYTTKGYGSGYRLFVTCGGSVQRFPPKVGADTKQRSGLSSRLNNKLTHEQWKLTR